MFWKEINCFERQSAKTIYSHSLGSPVQGFSGFPKAFAFGNRGISGFLAFPKAFAFRNHGITWFFEDSLRHLPLEIMKIQGFSGFPKAFPFRNHGISRFFEDFLRHLPLEIMKIQRIFFGNPDLSPFESTELWKEINCFERNKLFVIKQFTFEKTIYIWVSGNLIPENCFGKQLEKQFVFSLEPGRW